MQKIQPAKMILLMAWLVFSMYLKAQPAAIIPRPAAMEVFEGTLEITENMTLVYEYSNEELARIAMHFSHYLTDYYNIRLSPSPENKMFIQLELIPSLALNKEGYQIRINQDGIVISATSSNGIFYGIQTLKQLLPVPGLSSEKIEVPFVQISDQPRFVWRGLMLDVGRHFFPVAYIKNLLDYMAVYKLNTFHWHLTEDQGWRIEIKKYPALAELAHWRDETILGHASESETYDGIGYGGFYTQDQIKEIVQYAADRYITVVPEIEMPVHSSAALSAYP